MQNREWYLADLKSTGKNTIETVEKSLTDMFIRLVRIYPCLLSKEPVHQLNNNKRDIVSLKQTCIMENASHKILTTTVCQCSYYVP